MTHKISIIIMSHVTILNRCARKPKISLIPLPMERVLERFRRRFCLRGTRAEQALLLKKKCFTHQKKAFANNYAAENVRLLGGVPQRQPFCTPTTESMLPALWADRESLRLDTPGRYSYFFICVNCLFLDAHCDE